MTDTLTNQINWQPFKNSIKTLTYGLDHFDGVAPLLILDDWSVLSNVDAFISNQAGDQNLVIFIGAEYFQYTLLCRESRSCVRVRGHCTPHQREFYP